MPQQPKTLGGQLAATDNLCAGHSSLTNLKRLSVDAVKIYEPLVVHLGIEAEGSVM
jgi:sensor c-di-GMP phosphodiesterase-like protein